MDLVSSSESLIDELLEEYWFFENLFTRRSSRVLRYCHSDPYPSSSSSSLTSPEKIGDSDPVKIVEASTRRCLSMEPSIKIRVQEPRQDECFLRKKEPLDLPKSGSCSAPGKIQEASMDRGLIRTPSLPPRFEKREVDREAKKMISKLTRQFSEKIRVLEPTCSSERFLKKKEAMVREKRISNSSLQRTQTMPNNIRRREEEDELEDDQESDSRMGFLIREALSSSHNVPKVTSYQRQRPPRSLRTEGSSSSSSSSKTLRKTLSSVETTKEIQRMKDCYDQSNEPRVVTGLATPPRVPKDSRKEMKDQIKFWARAVASNVRQEC